MEKKFSYLGEGVCRVDGQINRFISLLVLSPEITSVNYVINFTESGLGPALNWFSLLFFRKLNETSWLTAIFKINVD
jgi:hypothetical protein